MIITKNEELKFKVFNINLYEKFKKNVDFFKEIEEDFDIEEILPDFKKLEWEENFENKKEEILKLDSNFNYIDIFNKHNNLFSKLENIFIDKLILKLFLEKENNETIISTLSRFKPNKKGFINPITYKRHNNVSGRLIVDSSANVLTLPKRCRSIFKSRFNEGEILSIDFISLEPRLCLKLSNVKDKEDIYEDIKNYLSFEIDRSVAKRATISVLYGKNSIDGFSKEKSDEILKIVKDYFKIDEIYKLSKNVDDLGIRRNCVGKPIWNLKEEKQHVLINNYIQSSAVDISLTYFSELIEKLNLKKSVPLFIIHDSLVFDVSKEYKEEFYKVIEKGYLNKNLGYFPIKIETFNRSKND